MLKRQLKKMYINYGVADTITGPPISLQNHLLFSCACCDVFALPATSTCISLSEDCL